MLTTKQNLLETIKGGNPDRFVNQNEFLEFVFEVPMVAYCPGPGTEIVDEWGITSRWPEGQLGPFPVHDEEHKVIKDITQWKKYLKVPDHYKNPKAWVEAKQHVSKIDQTEKHITIMIYPGIFEMTHSLMGMEDALMGLYEEPEAMHELIDCLTDYALDYAKVLAEEIGPTAIYQHDDWGSRISSFMAPETFKEFFLPAYKKIFGFYKANGVELIIHHSDSYALNLVPFMIEMGVDIWQGVMNTNNIPEMIKEFGGKISFMGGIHSGEVDFPEWNEAIVKEHVDRACQECGKLYFIPNLTQGADISSFPGVYEAVSAEIDRMSEEMFA